MRGLWLKGMTVVNIVEYGNEKMPTTESGYDVVPDPTAQWNVGDTYVPPVVVPDRTQLVDSINPIVLEELLKLTNLTLNLPPPGIGLSPDEYRKKMIVGK